MRNTKIVCTLGPATSSETMVARLIDAGMSVARLNFSHGSHDDHRRMIGIIRKVSAQLNAPVAILQDLQGPKLRVGKIKDSSVELHKGRLIRITTEDVIGTAELVSTTYKQLPNDVQAGDRILLDDGLLQLRVEEVQSHQIVCKILEGGTLSDHKGINLPGIYISQPSFTEKDHADLLFGIGQEVDLVAISFVRCAADVAQVKKLIAEHNKDILVLAKLEKPEAIRDLDAILTVADGAMIARGDLGVELPLEKVPLLQKQIIRTALQKGKPVITATQMLESMRFYTRPTRAEVSDVANAIFDGTDAVMLSAETATGKYPIAAVKTMAKIIVEAEQSLQTESTLRNSWPGNKRIHGIPDLISLSTCAAAEHLNLKAIIAFTTSGFTARMLAKYRPLSRIIAFTPSQLVQRQLSLSWGVVPMKTDEIKNTDEVVLQTVRRLLENKLVKPGDIVAILLGAPLFKKGTTNLMKLHVIGEDDEMII
ncbi:MAG: pyruvate kinase [Candidatus Zhuqueibacterota bacterium]